MIRLRGSAAAFTLLACAAQAPLAPLPQTPSLSALPQPATPLSPAKAAPAAPTAPVVSDGARSARAPVLAARPSLGDIGSPGQVLLLATSASGAWVALCDGEPSAAKLVLGSGSGEAIDDVLAQDATGRYLVAAQSGSAVLFDAVLATRVNLSELGADTRRVRADYAEHRALSFDPLGRYLAYLRTSGATRSVVVRALDTGAERVIAAGVGEVFRLRLSADARYVVLEALREDINHNGKLDWPTPEETTRRNACDARALPKFRTFGYQGRGDALTRAVVSLDAGTLRDVPQLVTTLGSSLLVRETDGSLQLDQAGKRTALAPASCGARVLFADAERALVLATCAPPPPKNSKKKNGAATPTPSGKREVWLFGSGYAKNLQSELYETSLDRDSVTGARLVPLYPGSEAGLLDLERRELLPLPTGSRVLATSGPLALVWRDSDLYRYDAAAKAEQLLAHGVLKTPELLQTGSAVLLSPFVVVGIEGPALGSPAQPLALSSSGFVLIGAAQAPATVPNAPARSTLRGPLHWVDAKLPPDAKVPPPDGPPR
jgi:hypothetical protein